MTWARVDLAFGVSARSCGMEGFGGKSADGEEEDPEGFLCSVLSI